MSHVLPIPHEHIVVTEFETGESVLVDLDTKRYYQLNETATLIWQGLAKGGSKADIVSRLTAVYAVSDEDAEKSVADVIESLKAHRLLVTT